MSDAGRIFDEDGEPLAPGAPRPRDAATLILIRSRRDGYEVLMGQRAKGHVFMPDKWVFPGGRVDRGDARAPALSELSQATEDKLRKHARLSHPRALALASVRETFEETGLIVGERGVSKGRPPAGWETYCDHGAAPRLDRLIFVCRAITPPARPRRFDARFFLAFAEEALLDDRPIAGGPELLDTRWFSFADAAGLDLPSVTRFVIGEISARLTAGDLGTAPPFLRWTRGKHTLERL